MQNEDTERVTPQSRSCSPNIFSQGNYCHIKHHIMHCVLSFILLSKHHFVYWILSFTLLTKHHIMHCILSSILLTKYFLFRLLDNRDDASETGEKSDQNMHRNTKCKIQNTKCKLQNTKYKTQNIKFQLPLFLIFN